MKQHIHGPYLLVIGITLLSYSLMYGLRALLSLRIQSTNKRSPWNDIVVPTFEHTGHLFMLATAVYLGFHFSPYYRKFQTYGNRVYLVVLMLQCCVWFHFMIDRWITLTIDRRTKLNPAAASSISLLKLCARLVIYSILFLFTLNNLGIKITTILAGLGVGGIAVALAVQKILGDLFSSLSIVIDKPFVVGDFIIMDQYMGDVEKIGLKTTRLRSLSGEQIIISNSDLLSARIRNYKRMHERRVVLLFTLVHGLSSEKLIQATAIVKSIVLSKSLARLDRCHFMDITPTSLNLELVYFALSDDYNLHMDLKQEILLEIYRAFEAEGLIFAYPTQTLHIKPTEVSITPIQSQERELSVTKPLL